MTHRIRMARKRLGIAKEQDAAAWKARKIERAERNLRAIERRKDKTA